MSATPSSASSCCIAWLAADWETKFWLGSTREGAQADDVAVEAQGLEVHAKIIQIIS